MGRQKNRPRIRRIERINADSPVTGLPRILQTELSTMSDYSADYKTEQIPLQFVPVEELHAVTQAILRTTDLAPDDAGIIADALVTSELRNLQGQGQGVRRVRAYVDRVRQRHVDPARLSTSSRSRRPWRWSTHTTVPAPSWPSRQCAWPLRRPSSAASAWCSCATARTSGRPATRPARRWPPAASA